MKLPTLWDKLCMWNYIFYIVIRYGLKGAEEITNDRYKKAVELNRKLSEKIENEKILL